MVRVMIATPRPWPAPKTLGSGTEAIIRPHADGTVDDVVIACTWFRMEQMTDTGIWAAAYRDVGGLKGVVAFWISWDKKAKRLIAYCQQDSLGCIDDTQKLPVPYVGPS